MRRWIAIASLLMTGACQYSASFSDCTVQCSAAAPDCPGGFSCSTAEGRCRAEGETASCDAVLDGGGGDDVDSAPSMPFTPSNLGSAADDLHAGTTDLVLTDATIDTDAGTITGVTLAPSDTRTQTQPAPAPSILVLRFRSLRIDGVVTVTGSKALAIVASDTITINGSLTHNGVSAACLSGSSGNGKAGGGGGGLGAAGGSGGLGDQSTVGGAGGQPTGTVPLVPLVSGCSGWRGSSVDTPGENGGRAGGAIQLVAGARIDLSGGICASGRGGGASGGLSGAGGGGSGGAVLLEAPTVNVVPGASLISHGGGGGGSGTGTAGTVSCDIANGGLGGTGFQAEGGDGGYGTVAAQNGGSSSNGPGGGGGGGGVGRIRINRADNSTPSGAVSPPPSLGTLTPL